MPSCNLFRIVPSRVKGLVNSTNSNLAEMQYNSFAFLLKKITNSRRNDLKSLPEIKKLRPIHYLVIAHARRRDLTGSGKHTHIYLAGFSKRLSTATSPVSRVPSSQTFQSQALIKIATVRISELVWTF